MTAQIIDGKLLAQKLRSDWKPRADRLNALGIAPGLAVVIVGDNPASQVYVRNKIKACREIGIRSEEHALPADTTLETVLALIDRLNADAAIHGILVQLPLPAQLAQAVVIERISPEKDVDGLHLHNLGNLLAGHARFVPCTPAGIMEMLKTTGLDLRGRNFGNLWTGLLQNRILITTRRGGGSFLCLNLAEELVDRGERAPEGLFPDIEP